MKNNNYQKYIVIIYTLIIFVLMVTVGYRVVRRGVLRAEEDVVDKTATVDWEQRYPFENKPTVSEDYPVEDTLVDKYLNKVHGIESTLEWYCTEGFLLKEKGINVISAINRMTGTDVILGSDISMNIHDEYIVTLIGENETDGYANNVIEFNDFAKKANIPLLYAESIYKIERNETDPLVSEDYANRNADRLLSKIENAGVECLDLREQEAVEGIDHYDFFFKSDTHWKPSAGLWAAKEISECVNERFGLGLDTQILERDNYDSVVYEKVFLGSQGRRVGLNYCKPEDFEVLIPSFSTDVSYVSESAGINAAGDFSDCLIDWSRFDTIDYYGNSCYASYMGGRQPMGIIRNQLADNGLRILLLTDSFGDTVAPFIAMECSELLFADPRLFNGSVEKMVLESEPDIIIMLYNPEVITDETPESNSSIYMLK